MPSRARAKSDRTSLSSKDESANIRFAAVMNSAQKSGLLGEKSARIAGRTSRELIARAKERTGIAKDTDLIEFALANVALDDDFAEAFRSASGSVDSALKLGF
jgi:hypothetical protein